VISRHQTDQFRHLTAIFRFSGSFFLAQKEVGYPGTTPRAVFSGCDVPLFLNPFISFSPFFPPINKPACLSRCLYVLQGGRPRLSACYLSCYSSSNSRVSGTGQTTMSITHRGRSLSPSRDDAPDIKKRQPHQQRTPWAAVIASVLGITAVFAFLLSSSREVLATIFTSDQNTLQNAQVPPGPASGYHPAPRGDHISPDGNAASSPGGVRPEDWILPAVFLENSHTDRRLQNCVWPATNGVDNRPKALCVPGQTGRLTFHSDEPGAASSFTWAYELRKRWPALRREALNLPRDNFSPYCHHTDICSQPSWHVFPLMILEKRVEPNLVLVPAFAEAVDFMVSLKYTVS